MELKEKLKKVFEELEKQSEIKIECPYLVLMLRLLRLLQVPLLILKLKEKFL